MCGIAGFTLCSGLPAEERRARFGGRLLRMVASLRHRGPDAQRALLLDGVALGHARLSIVDLEGGAQPMRDPATGVTIVFNGEIFNYLELREQLRSRHAFRTRSDTEAILACYLHRGIDCVLDFIGQFAFAIYDPRIRTLWLARDRIGILPLQYTETAEGFAFASEAKALFAGGWQTPALDARGVKQTLQLWSPVLPRTVFAGVSQLAPGSVGRWSNGRFETWRYWDADLGVEPRAGLDPARAEKELGALLEDAVRLRLRADVPVAAYLSGGLDSSLLSAIAQSQLGGTLKTFSIGFADQGFDERAFQDEMAAKLATDHRSVLVSSREIGELLPAVVRHAEQILLRPAPAPMLRLSALVRESATKVVLTGEGADEIFLGYDLYRETRVREFWARRPGSRSRPALLRRLYPYLPMSQQGHELLQQFFAVGLHDPQAAGFSHLPRWAASGRIQRFLAPGFAELTADEDPVASAIALLPARVKRWKPLARAQYLEMQTLLAGYLLSAQGDRMLMGNSVEGRFPFLDHRLIEFAAALPERLKLRGLAEKWILKRYAARWVPPAIVERTKYPYRAPIAHALAGPEAPVWARELLSREAARKVGVFDEVKVEKLAAKLSSRSAAVSEADSQALTAIATTQLLADRLLPPSPVPQGDVDAVRLDAA
jgi:asparagine synthase (glutamine-hydrolysing)